MASVQDILDNNTIVSGGTITINGEQISSDGDVSIAVVNGEVLEGEEAEAVAADILDDLDIPGFDFG